MQPNSRSAYLIIRQGNRWSDVFRLEKGRTLVIGRASSNEIPVADERASRRHAEVYYQDGEWWVRDLESRNGTLVDGRKIEAPKQLTPGNLIAVASCKMTFVHNLDEFSPPVDQDPKSDQSPSKTLAEITPSITLRKSTTRLLESREIDPKDVPSLRAAGNEKRVEHNVAPVASTLLPLAFELAQQTSVGSACDLALTRLMKTVGVTSGGVLRIDAISADKPNQGEESNSLRISILAAREESGRAYHPVSESILVTLQKDPSAILARNVASDPQLLGDDSGAASHVLSTASMIAAPIRVDEKLYGVVHLYSKVGERDLTPDDLEVTLAIAEVLGVSIHNLMRAQKLETRLKSSNARITELEQQLGHGEWIGASTSLKQVQEQVARVAPTQATILIRGESGTGKELVARAIHDRSPRASGPFVAINCAALTPTLLESELFGHEKGAFTGATDRKLGKFELAHTGTLMLDELGEMSLEIQAKFLRVLEAKVFERVGGNKSIQVDVRVVAATNRDLEQAVREGTFRSDLYFRLRVIELRIPALRDRRDDILPLAMYFLKQFRSRSGHGPVGFSERAQQAMREYLWPGNVRELKNSVERAFVLAASEVAEPEDLALSHVQVPGTPSATPVISYMDIYRERTLEEIEREHIEATLKYTGGQKNRAASILGIERSTLDRKLKRMVDPDA